MRTFMIVLIAAVTQASYQNGNNNGGSSVRRNVCGILPPSCPKSKYRSVDGSCNNLRNPNWGTPFSPYARLTRNSYSDGVHAFPLSSNKEPLPNARDVSLQVSPDVVVKDPIWTILTLQWGQVLAHDMSFTADITQTGEESLVCCKDGQLVTPASNMTNPKCAPILITSRDPYNFPEGNVCFDFVRTSTNKDRRCSLPGRVEEPLTTVTSYLDLSIVYGSDEESANKVRAFTKGKLASVIRNGEEWLPQDPNPSACNVKVKGEPCYLAGDVRVNQNPQLAILQTLFVREHNRIAEKLCTFINPQWDDERCYQEARRINIAKAQHISYNEFLPIFLGMKNMISRGLLSKKTTGYVNDYDKTVNAQILNEHATGAFRALHTLIVGYLKVYSEDRKFKNEIRLSDWFNRPSIIEVFPSGLARGLVTQHQNANDRFYDDEISQYLFRKLNEILGDDLRATDVQRGRDHGLPPYATLLHICGLGKPKSFHDLEKYIQPYYVRLLAQIYNKVGDVESSIGGLLEDKVKGTLSGPTFRCIMTEQFKRTRIGDRYFYENGHTDGAFTKEQLNSIRKTTAARLFCDNYKDINSMQPEAFRVISDTNALEPCYKLPQEDLWLWKETPGLNKYGSLGGNKGGVYPGAGNTGPTNGGTGNTGGVYPGAGNTGPTNGGTGNTGGVYPGAGNTVPTNGGTGNTGGVYPGAGNTVPTNGGTGNTGGVYSGAGNTGPTNGGTGNTGGVYPGAGNTGPTNGGTGNTGGVYPGAGNTGPTNGGTGNTGGVYPGAGNTGPTTGNTGGVYPGAGNTGPTNGGTGNTGGVYPGAGNTGPTDGGTGNTGGVYPGAGNTGPTNGGTGNTGGVYPGAGNTGPTNGGTGNTGGVYPGAGNTGPTNAGTGNTGGVYPGAGNTGPTNGGTGNTGGVYPGAGNTGPTNGGTGNTGGVYPGTA